MTRVTVFRAIGIATIGSFSRGRKFSVLLSEPLQRNAKHEARLSNSSEYFSWFGLQVRTEIESLASRTSSAALQLRSAQNEILEWFYADVRHHRLGSDSRARNC